MKKLLNLMAFIAIALLVSNCGGNEAKTPATLEKSFYTELQKGNYEKAADLIIKNLSTDKVMTAEESAQLVKSFTEKAKQSGTAHGCLFHRGRSGESEGILRLHAIFDRRSAATTRKRRVLTA